MGLLWIFSIVCVFATSNGMKPLDGHLLHQELKESLFIFILELKNVTKDDELVDEAQVKEFAHRLKMFNQGESKKLAGKKPYYKKMLEAAQSLFQFIEYEAVGSHISNFFKYVKEDDCRAHFKFFVEQLGHVVSNMNSGNSDVSVEIRLRYVLEMKELLVHTMNDQLPACKMSAKDEKIVAGYFEELKARYSNNTNIMDLVNWKEQRASGNALKGRELTKDEFKKFKHYLSQYVEKVATAIGGIYVIYVDGKCEIYSEAVDHYLTTVISYNAITGSKNGKPYVENN